MTNETSPHDKRTLIGLPAKKKIAEGLGIYNSGTVGVTKKQLDRIETAYRRQLREKGMGIGPEQS